MDLLNDIITYVRRIIKSPSNAQITDNLIIDYINRFWIMDVDARIQLFDLKTKYQFITTPGVDQYNMPLYTVQTQPGNQVIGPYPVYQGFVGPAYINGIQVPLQTEKNWFFNIYPNITQQLFVVAVGNGTAGPYTINFPILPSNSTPINPPINCILRGHVDMTGIISSFNFTGIVEDPLQVTPTQINNIGINPSGNFIQDVPVANVFPAVYITAIGADGSNVIIADSGQFLQGNTNFGLLMQPGAFPGGTGISTNGNLPLVNGPNPAYSITQNTINYFTGVATNVYFPNIIPKGSNINATCFFFQTGLPRSVLFYNNTLTLRSPPDNQYIVELDAFLSPAAFLNSANAIPFGYTAEYIARGAARKILSDTGDIEQLQLYEPFFREQEMLVWKRSQRQWTASRTQTIYSQGLNQGQSGFNNIGGATI